MKKKKEITKGRREIENRQRMLRNIKIKKKEQWCRQLDKSVKCESDRGPTNRCHSPPLLLLSEELVYQYIHSVISSFIFRFSLQSFTRAHMYICVAHNQAHIYTNGDTYLQTTYSLLLPLIFL